MQDSYQAMPSGMLIAAQESKSAFRRCRTGARKATSPFSPFRRCCLPLLRLVTLR